MNQTIIQKNLGQASSGTSAPMPDNCTRRRVNKKQNRMMKKTIECDKARHKSKESSTTRTQVAVRRCPMTAAARQTDKEE